MLHRAIGSGIGLAQEAYVHNKEKKAHAAEQTHQPGTTPTPSADASQGYDHEKEDDEEIFDDGEYWEIDEAHHVNTPPAYDEHIGEHEHEETQKKKKPKKTLELFLTGYEARHPGLLARGYDPAVVGRMSLPVVLPQRRPTTRSRGFVRGYPPILEPWGISDSDWFDFLDTLDQAIKTSPLFCVVNAALELGHLIPEIWIHFVVMAAHASVEAARRYKMVMNTNNFLYDANERFFKPLGLYCLLMQYKPGSKEGVEAVNVVQYVKEIAMTADHKATDEGRGTTRRFNDKLRMADGKSLGELELPEAASLVFPALHNHDATGAANDAGSSQQQSGRWARTKAFTADYYDRRGQAQYNARNPDSKLSVTPEPTFAGRWADPNHAANKGVVGMLTGGTVNLSRLPVHRVLKKVRGRGPMASVRRVIEGNVIYLVVTEMPTQEEMRQAELEWNKQAHGNVEMVHGDEEMVQ